jgi:hypothetical protein
MIIRCLKTLISLTKNTQLRGEFRKFSHKAQDIFILKKIMLRQEKNDCFYIALHNICGV